MSSNTSLFLLHRPEIRDILIDSPSPLLPDREVLMWVLSNLHINWPYSNDQIFTWDDSGATGVSPRFTAQVMDLNNWAINVTVARRYPVLRGKARFVELEATDPGDIRGREGW